MLIFAPEKPSFCFKIARMPLPQQLLDIRDYLIANPLELSSPHQDGRINASVNEDEVLTMLRRRFNIISPQTRNWYDFAVQTGSDFYPVNIKITNTTHADNLNCKLGIYYALTGLIPDFANEIRWVSYFEKLKNNIGATEKDYYFLILNKSDSADVFINTLKGLDTLQPNGNNLPFQCKWDNNKVFRERSFQDAVDFIMTNLGQSIRLRSEIYLNFKEHFSNYV
ncbi:MAG: hypothetical protein KA168_00610 [Chitinophagales bacterium]|nr:hypothetical protein [Chitinophagales bacterium]